jgi:hypothetical protein
MTSQEEKLVNQQVISGKRIFIECGSSGNSSRSISSKCISQVSKPHEGGITTNFIMEGQYPTIMLLEF